MTASNASSPRRVAATATNIIPPCPLGLNQHPRACLGHYERECQRLQIRMLMRADEGVCTVLVDENASLVTICVIACRSADPMDRLGYPGDAEERHHVWLEVPLRDRSVIDRQTGRPMPFYVPTFWNGQPTKAPGYYTDLDAARAGWELVEDITDCRARLRRNAPRWSRTLGY